jgi:hypothetical protein
MGSVNNPPERGEFAAFAELLKVVANPAESAARFEQHRKAAEDFKAAAFQGRRGGRERGGRKSNERGRSSARGRDRSQSAP